VRRKRKRIGTEAEGGIPVARRFLRRLGIGEPRRADRREERQLFGRELREDIAGNVADRVAFSGSVHEPVADGVMRDRWLER